MMKSKKSRPDYFLEDGTPVPQTTKVIGLLAKPHMIIWANKLGLLGIDSTDYRDDAVSVGNCVHTLIAAHLRKVEPDLSMYSSETISQAENALIKFWEWEKRIGGIEPIFVEESIVSEVYGYGGTPDCYCKIGDQHWLIDFKTGKAVYPEAGIQLAAYRELLLEKGLPVDGCRVVRIGRDEDEGFEDKTFGETILRLGFAIFKHLLAIYQLRDVAAKEKKQETIARRKAKEAENLAIQEEKERLKAAAREEKALAKAASQEEKERLKAEKLAAKNEKALIIASSKVRLVRSESIVELV